MAVKIADGDSIAYWQTVDRDAFDGPFIVRQPTPWDKDLIDGEYRVVEEKRLSAPTKPATTDASQPPQS